MLYRILLISYHLILPKDQSVASHRLQFFGMFLVQSKFCLQKCHRCFSDDLKENNETHLIDIEQTFYFSRTNLTKFEKTLAIIYFWKDFWKFDFFKWNTNLELLEKNRYLYRRLLSQNKVKSVTDVFFHFVYWSNKFI